MDVLPGKKGRLSRSSSCLKAYVDLFMSVVVGVQFKQRNASCLSSKIPFNLKEKDDPITSGLGRGTLSGVISP